MGNRVYISIFIAVFFLISEECCGMRVRSVIERDTTRSAIIYFDFNRSDVDAHYASNQKAIELLDTLLINLRNRTYLTSLVLTSSVSPDGNVLANERLSARRNEEVRDYLRQRYPFIDSVTLEFCSRGEDWDELRELIVADPGVPDKEEVLILIDYHRDNAEKRKELLKKLNGKKSYRYILNHILPKLRRSEILLKWKYPAVEKAVEAAVAIPVMVDTAVAEMEEVFSLIAETPELERRRKTVLALKNNLLYDVALAPNIEVEVPIGNRWSVNVEYKCPWWLNNSGGFCYQLMSGGVEGRYWLGNRQVRHELTGHFFGVYAEGGSYDFQFGGDGYQGRYYGASGVTYGYVKQVARHLALEFSLGVGYLTTEYRKYASYKGDLVWTNSGRYNFIGPTKAKVSLVWFIKTRR